MWGRAFAGVIPGFFFAAALTGFACWLPPGPWQQWIVPGLIAFIPIWMCVIGASFAFSGGKQAWIGLTSAATLGMGSLWTLVALGWVQ